MNCSWKGLRSLGEERNGIQFKRISQSHSTHISLVRFWIWPRKCIEAEPVLLFCRQRKIIECTPRFLVPPPRSRSAEIAAVSGRCPMGLRNGECAAALGKEWIYCSFVDHFLLMRPRLLRAASFSAGPLPLVLELRLGRSACTSSACDRLCIEPWRRRAPLLLSPQVGALSAAASFPGHSAPRNSFLSSSRHR